MENLPPITETTASTEAEAIAADLTHAIYDVRMLREQENRLHRESAEQDYRISQLAARLSELSDAYELFVITPNEVTIINDLTNKSYASQRLQIDKVISLPGRVEFINSAQGDKLVITNGQLFMLEVAPKTARP